MRQRIASLTAPKATDSFTKMGLKDGKYSWSVKCTDDKGKAGGSAIWNVTIAPEGLTKCKTSGFKANTRYKVMLPVLSTGGDAPDVYVYWGLSDGGTVKGNWQSNELVAAEQAAGL